MIQPGHDASSAAAVPSRVTQNPRPLGRAPRRSSSGQAILEFLIIAVVAILGLFAVRQPLSQAIHGLLGDAAEKEQEAATTLANLRLEGMPPWAGERAQGEPEEIPEDDGEIVVASGPQPGGGPAVPRPSPPIDSGGLDGSGGGRGGGGGGSGGTGGSAGGGAGGTGSGPVVDGGGGGGPPPESVEPKPGIVARSPNTAERTLLDAARNLLLTSAITFDLFDFTLGQVVTHAVAQTTNNISLFGVPMLVADLVTTIGALAAVFFQTQPDGTVDFSKPISLVFDERVLATFTKEKVAAVMAHEGWHVNQVFNGIMNDFTHYPRVVDIEYEAFVAGAAVWNATKGTQTEPIALDQGSACVAAGEARCKEILVTDFNYPTGPRQG